MMKPITLAGILCLAAPSLAAAADPLHQPYGGQDDRAISSLSAKDIEDISNGRGWGLAKPAELNGYPGPLHVLELKDQLQLSPGQRAKTKAIFAKMKARAIAIGTRYLESEKNVDALFKSGRVGPAVLARALDEAARLRAQLRQVHLAAHLETTPLLTRHQRHLYLKLRGYAGKGSHNGHAH